MKAVRKFFVSGSLALFVLTFLSTAAFAVLQHMQTINYQGYLADAEGTPVNGSLSIRFKIYNTPTGGSPLWTETQTSVTVTDGAFSVTLGSVTPINLLFDEQYYLGVTVAGDAEMTPRAVLVSVPYAIRAGAAEMAEYASSAGVADSALSADTAVTLGDKTLSEIVSILDSRYGNLGDSLVADFGATPVVAEVNDPINFTDLTVGVPTSWSWDFGDTGTSTLQNPSYAYASDGTYTVALTAYDGVTSNTTTKPGYITVYPHQGITLDSGGTFNSIANGADGLPVIAYRDYNGTLKVIHCGDVACATGNTMNTIDANAMNCSIAIGEDGLPVISYSISPGSGLKVVHCGNFRCSSGNTINTVDTSGGVNSIAIGGDGLPVMAYLSGGNIKVLHCGDADCTPATNSITNAVSPAPNYYLYVGKQAIAMDSIGLPVISYLDYNYIDEIDEYNRKLLHCGDASCASGNTTQSQSCVYDGVCEPPSLAIAADDSTYVSYYYAAGGSYGVLRINGITRDSAWGGQDSSIAIGSDGLPIVSYYDAANKDLKVLHCGDTNCSTGNSITSINSGHNIGQHTSLAIGPDGFPVILFWDQTNNEINVLHCENVECTAW